MIYYLKTYFIPILFLCINELGYSQEASAFSLLTEKYTQKPITVHKGQFQFNSGYNLSILNRKFDSDGSIINLRKEGTVGVKHLFPFEIKFGVLEYLQIEAGINYAKTGIRNQNQLIVGNTAYLDRDELIQVAGPDDLYLGLDLRAPTSLSFLDIVLSAGYYLAVSNNEPDKPEHFYLADTSGRVDINYDYKTKFSSGVNSLSIAGSLKYKSPKISATGSYQFISGIEDGESITWITTLSGNTLEYYSAKYNFNIGQRMEWKAEAAFQAIDWLTLMISGRGYTIKNAWSEITTKKVGIKAESLIVGKLGYEIQITPSLRLNQFLCYPFAGKNSMAAFTFMTGLSVNLISLAYHNAF